MAETQHTPANESSAVRGMLDTEMLKDLISKDEIETVIAAFPDMYGRLLGKRITGNYFVTDVLEAV